MEFLINDFPSAMPVILARVILMFLKLLSGRRFSLRCLKKEGLFMCEHSQERLTRSVVNEVLLRIVRMILNLRFFCPQTVSFLSALYQSWQHISVIWEKDIP